MSAECQERIQSGDDKMIITDDLIQWLLADKKVRQQMFEISWEFYWKVCNAWRQFAVRLGLESFIPTIIGFRENNKLKILFDVWKEESLETYNVEVLKNILSKEVENI